MSKAHRHSFDRKIARIVAMDASNVSSVRARRPRISRVSSSHTSSSLRLFNESEALYDDKQTPRKESLCALFQSINRGRPLL